MGIWISSLITAFLFFSQTASASLGNSETTIPTEISTAHAQGQSSTQQMNGYKIYEMTQTSVSFREYIAPSGTIFAIAWQGSHHPNVRALLGDYYDEFIHTVNSHHQKIHANRAPISLDSARMHIEIGGHVNAVYGRIWLKDSIPSGVTAKEIH